MEGFLADTGHILPVLAIMETGDFVQSMEERVNQVTDKLCPFDKQPCIRERCEVFREELGICSFCLLGASGKPRPAQKDEKTSSKYKVHLFD